MIGRGSSVSEWILQNFLSSCVYAKFVFSTCFTLCFSKSRFDHVFNDRSGHQFSSSLQPKSCLGCFCIVIWLPLSTQRPLQPPVQCVHYTSLVGLLFSTNCQVMHATPGKADGKNCDFFMKGFSPLFRPLNNRRDKIPFSSRKHSIRFRSRAR